MSADKTTLSPAKERVKAYLEEQIKNDEALRTLYAPSKIKECFQYITDQAKKKAQSGSYFAGDVEVWKWARDYFIEELPKKAEKAPIEIEAKKEAAEKTAETAAETADEAEMIHPENEKAGTPCEEAEVQTENAMSNQAEGGEEACQETAAETADEAEMIHPENEKAVVTDEYGFEVFGEEKEEEKPEEKPEEKAEEIKYDSDGNGLLFGFLPEDEATVQLGTYGGQE